ncbi:MAG: shikimate dehydrogenase [Clostridia bacterium]|nr:shikimate dehydrogenase [Clostridia bacterium]
MIYGCIAEKLGHSFSKDIHNRLFDYSYELCEVPKDELDAFMRKKDFKAINVTIPYKESVIPYLDWISDTAKMIGAVNTIVNEDGYLRGYNTDFSGLSALINRNGIELKGKKVLILGSGGTSKTALAVSKSMECSSVYRVSRDGKEDCITYSEAKEKHRDAEVIINTTPVGMYPKIGFSPIDLEDYPRVDAVIDAVYNPLRSKLVYDARKKGINAVGGLYMLVAQAAVAAEKFIDTEVPVSEIDRVYGELVRLKENIVLTGMPGSGKSTIGKLLAKELGRVFIDTDEEIVKRINKPIPQIFAEEGEEAFRKLETEVIIELSSVQSAVIATGGGAILNSLNIEMLGENGRIYFIDRNIENIVATSDRPLSSNRADLEKRYRERYPLYTSRCDRHIRIGNDAQENMQMIKKDFCDEDTCN